MRAPNSIRARPGRDQGFTLAELIVATTLIVIVMTGVYTSFSVAIQAWREGETNYKTYEDARLAMGILARELQAVPPSTIHLFNGDRRSVEFYTLAPPLNESKGKGERILWVKYRLMARGGDTGSTLLREEAIVLGPLPAPPREDQRVNLARIKKGPRKRFEIATGIKRFELSYYWSPRVMRNRDEPPSQVKIFVEQDVDSALPHGVGITLGIHDPGAPSGESTFSNIIAFRGVTSRLPEKLIDQSRQRYF